MALTEPQLARRGALKARMRQLQTTIGTNIDKLTDPNLTLPDKTILDIYRQQEAYANAVVFLNSLGAQLFQEEWPDKPVLGLNGHPVKSDQ